MDYLWIFVAFVFGFIAKQMYLPPLIGYLLAGFALHTLGVTPDSSLEKIGEVGVTLLLFSIGLKLNVGNLVKREVWAGALGHMAAITGLTIVNSLFLGALGLIYFADLDFRSAAIIGFAVSFSSTVIAVKALEARAEMRVRHGQLALGILIIQDIAAVLFVTLSAGKSPSLWILCLPALVLLRPLLGRLLDRCGHGELLPLAGIFLAYSGGQLFEWVGLKAHLGALVVAILLSGHSKASELSRSLMNFKDLFLIGFFLSIGFTALPTLNMLGAAFIMAIALPVKATMFFVWLTRLRLRSRTAFLAAINLSSYSEFGLIVCAISVQQGLLAKEWLVIMALSVSLSFIFSSIVNLRAHRLYERWLQRIQKFERADVLPHDQFVQPRGASILIIGMGRVGTGAYDTVADDLQQPVCGIDVEQERIKMHCEAGRHVIYGDAEDPEFWSQLDLSDVQLVMFTMPNYLDILQAQHQLQRVGYQGKTASIVRYEDEKEALLGGGIDEVFNFYAKAGTGLADQSIHLLKT
ncbi:MAG: cation:proton antiporter [Pseudomonadales bacterium]|nr:cation:proton antiporter [Gammaproteobacteria bacterium]NNL56899.1 cation:proton antiporter [Pseudomonadales bacterium]